MAAKAKVEEVKKEDQIRIDAAGKADELAKKLNCRVHQFIFKGDKGEDDWLVGFIKEPVMLVKARAMDKMMMGQGFSVGGELVEACLIREETDPRIYSTLEENANYVLGSWKVAADLVAISLDQSKKK